jgi:hypothetical protein
MIPHMGLGFLYDKRKTPEDCGAGFTIEQIPVD